MLIGKSLQSVSLLWAVKVDKIVVPNFLTQCVAWQLISSANFYMTFYLYPVDNSTLYWRVILEKIDYLDVFLLLGLVAFVSIDTGYLLFQPWHQLQWNFH